MKHVEGEGQKKSFAGRSETRQVKQKEEKASDRVDYGLGKSRLCCKSVHSAREKYPMFRNKTLEAPNPIQRKGRRAPAAARIERPAVAGEKAAAELAARLEVAAAAAEVELVPAVELEARLAEDEAAVLDAAADDEAREADDEAAEEAAEVEEAAPLDEEPEAAAFKHELSDEPRTTRGEA